MPAGEVTLPIPNNIPKLDTTTSLAAIPDISATTTCHIPRPAGLRIGDITFPIIAP